MRFRLTAAAVLAALFAWPAGGQPPQAGKEIPAPVPGGKVKLVPRDSLRAGPGTTQFRLPAEVRSLLDPGPRLDVPQKVDWSKDRQGGKIDLPLLGNDRYGDCYPVACVHRVQAANAAATGKRIPFTTREVVNWYLRLSPRDTGTYSGQVLPEFKAGIVPPGREHKILDYALVSPSDPDAVRLALWAFGPSLWTCSLLDSWQNNVRPDAAWDASGRADPRAGHAMLLLSDDGDSYLSSTWGFTVDVTHKGVQVAQSEIVSCFSLDWFDPEGYAPNGQHYEVLAPLWTSVTGHPLPKSPFPAPKPAPPAPPIPVPPAPTPVGPYTLTLKAGDVVPGGVTVNVTVPGVTPAPAPAPAPTPAPGPTPSPAPIPWRGPAQAKAADRPDHDWRIETVEVAPPSRVLLDGNGFFYVTRDGFDGPQQGLQCSGYSASNPPQGDRQLGETEFVFDGETLPYKAWVGEVATRGLRVRYRAEVEGNSYGGVKRVTATTEKPPERMPAPAAKAAAGTPPGPSYSWRHLDGIGWGWVEAGVPDRNPAPAVPAPAPAQYAPATAFAPVYRFTSGGCANGQCRPR